MATPKPTETAVTSLIARIAEAAKGNLLGEIVTFRPCETTLPEIREALADNGLDPSVARGLEPEAILSRAGASLRKGRVIRKLEPSDGMVRAQFTRETEDDGIYSYDLEQIVSLEPLSGTIECPDAELRAKVQEAYDHATGARSSNDVTVVVKALFEADAGLFPLREAGGVYFVPAAASETSSKIARFLDRIGGGLRRFPVPAGTEHGDASVRDAVADGIQGLIDEHEAAVEGLSPKTRPSTLEKQVEKIRLSRLKIDAYSVYLKDESSRLAAALDATAQKLKEKIAAMADSEDDAAPEAAAPATSTTPAAVGQSSLPF